MVGWVWNCGIFELGIVVLMDGVYRIKLQWIFMVI